MLTKRLTQIVRFREFPFGFEGDPSMRTAMSPKPWPEQAEAIAYLQQGIILAIPMGAGLRDPFDHSCKAIATIRGECCGGCMPLTDGEWFWHAGLVYMVERYNVQLPAKFMDYAAARNWRIPETLPAELDFDFDGLT